MTKDEIYESTKNETMTWKEVIEEIYNNVFDEGYKAALNDVNEFCEKEADQIGKSKVIGVRHIRLICKGLEGELEGRHI